VPYTATDHHRHSGTVVGDGHCVAYVREVCGLPHTSLWRRGDPVRGSGCAPGTAIATFDPNGLYGNHTDGRSHTAVLLSENSDGLLVSDQWRGQPVHQRVIRYRGGSGNAVNDGDMFYVVEIAIE
jgi:hypothetical protein